jgi:hypothetical protein
MTPYVILLDVPGASRAQLSIGSHGPANVATGELDDRPARRRPRPDDTTARSDTAQQAPPSWQSGAEPTRTGDVRGAVAP